MSRALVHRFGIFFGCDEGLALTEACVQLCAEPASLLIYTENHENQVDQFHYYLSFTEHSQDRLGHRDN